MLPWVVLVLEQVPVAYVACLSVQSDHPGIIPYGSTIFEFQWSRIVAVHQILIDGVRIQPRGPRIRKGLDLRVNLRIREILNVAGPGVVVAMDWIVCYIKSIEFLFNHICDISSA